MKMLRLMFFAVVVSVSMMCNAQQSGEGMQTAAAAQPNNSPSEDWEPVAIWPFAYKEFKNAVIYTTMLQVVKGKANIHVGNHYVWYESKGKRLEAKHGVVTKVVFEGGDTYYPVNDKLCLVLREDTIEGKVCRLYMSHELNREEFNEMARRNNHAVMSTIDGLGFLNGVASRVADNEGANMLEQEPLPMRDRFYMLYDGDVFEATESNILKHLSKQERIAYRAYTRRAEVLSYSRKSMMDVWITFFASKL